MAQGARGGPRTTLEGFGQLAQLLSGGHIKRQAAQKGLTDQQALLASLFGATKDQTIPSQGIESFPRPEGFALDDADAAAAAFISERHPGSPDEAFDAPIPGIAPFAPARTEQVPRLGGQAGDLGRTLLEHKGPATAGRNNLLAALLSRSFGQQDTEAAVRAKIAAEGRAQASRTALKQLPKTDEQQAQAVERARAAATVINTGTRQAAKQGVSGKPLTPGQIKVDQDFGKFVSEFDAQGGRITQDEYDKKARELKERQAEIATRIEQHQEGEGSFRTTLEALISVASRAAEIFERSTTDEKRQLIAFVFSNPRMSGKKLEFSLRSPFGLMVDRADYPGWLAFLDTARTQRFNQILRLSAAVEAVWLAFQMGSHRPV